jgi:hypothetical protein
MMEELVFGPELMTLVSVMVAVSCAGAFSVRTQVTVVTVAMVSGNGHPRGMPLVSHTCNEMLHALIPHNQQKKQELADVQAEQRRETQWYPRV